ncbi:MAG: tetratricopeptide repeat protein [Gemmatimonadaceae bacterium]
MKLIRKPLIASTLALVVSTSVGSAQSVAEHIAAGDRAHAAFNSAEALKEFDAAIVLDSTNDEALGKASRAAVDIGESEPNRARRDSLFRVGERYARAAVAANPNVAEHHFALARALGRAALSVGVRDRVKYAKEIRAEALKALEIDANHPGALHVMGVWNAEVMRLNGVQKFFAKSFLGGAILGTANWKDAVSYMERAVAVDPERLTHRLDLAKIYIDVKDTAKAREQLQHIEAATQQTDINDPGYKREAKELLARIR